MKQPLLISVSLLFSLIFMFHSVNSFDNSYDEESDLDQNEPECGIPYFKPKVHSRIIGGVEATPHSWPWMVSIKNRVLDWAHECGGSVLNSRWVITAAHCVDTGDPDDFEIVLGEHNLTKKEGAEQKFKVDEIVIHKNYLFPRNDIALMRLQKNVEFNRYVKPICLPDEDVKDGTYCVATGWGNTYSIDKINVLNQVYLPVISNKICNQLDWRNGTVTENMICAGYENGGKSGCRGDSGGPLAGLRGGKWTLYGLTSGWGRCAEPKHPGVYTRVMNYIDWIREKTEQYDY